MITTQEARALRDAGLEWRPRAGDAFALTRAELEGDIFTVSDMTIEPHDFDTGTVLGFNGTTEWALDSVAIEDALWLPREDQLRDLLGGAFRSLRRVGAEASLPGGAADGSVADSSIPDGSIPDGSIPDSSTSGGVVPDSYAVIIHVTGEMLEFDAATPASAYARALLALIEAATL
jgi:hypothetical protein